MLVLYKLAASRFSHMASIIAHGGNLLFFKKCERKVHKSFEMSSGPILLAVNHFIVSHRLKELAQTLPRRIAKKTIFFVG